ncbi:MAG: DNA polymerase III subunit delta [Microthrixaceae bacterium]
MAADAARSPVHLLKGGDEVLISEATHDLVARLVGDADRNEVLDEFSGDEYASGQIVMAATTMSMFGSRVVVGRNCARFGAEDLAPIIAYLADPSPESTVVLVWEKGLASGSRANAVPKKLTDAVKAAGGEIHDCGLPGGKGRGMWVDEQLSGSPVRLNARARTVLIEQLGDDLSRLGGVLTVLEATFGDTEIGPDDLAPFLGAAGAVPPWELTDAIDGGRVPEAVEKLHRMLAGGARHPLQVMVSLQSHVERMLRLDGSGVRDEQQAAALLGMKGSTFPAKKALAQSRKLGSAKLARATRLIAAADVDLRGRTEQPGDVVLETLVARLAAMSSSGGRSRSGGGRPRRG